MIRKKSWSLLIIMSLMLNVLLVGCGSSDTKSKNDTGKNATIKNDASINGEVKQENARKIKPNQGELFVAYFAGLPSLEPYVNRMFPMIEEETGKKVRLGFTRSHDEFMPLLDRADSPDFVYIPASVFSTYVTGKSRFGGNSDKYIVIAGSSVGSSMPYLYAKPEIKSIKQLTGKKVGIPNLFYSSAIYLDSLLMQNSLSINNVNIVWDDIAAKLIDNYASGKYEAILTAKDNGNGELIQKKVPGTNEFPLGENTKYGKKPVGNWLIVKKSILKENPELVKKFLKADILSMEKAKENPELLGTMANMQREDCIQWWRDKGVKDEKKLAADNPLSRYTKIINRVEPTIDPNFVYINDLIAYYHKTNILPKYQVKDIVDLTLLNEVLKEMGKPEVQ